jgi:hypothetical protein
MNDINYQTDPSGFSLTTNAPQAQAVGMPSLGGAGGPPGMDVFLALAKRRMAQEQELRMAEERRRQAAFDMNLTAQDQQMRHGAEAADMQKDAARTAEERAQYQDQLMRSGPPLEMRTGFNITPGYQMDTTRMNGYQRQMFLPNQSAATNGGLTAGETSDIDARSSIARATGRDPGRRAENPFDPLAANRSRLA